MGFPHAEAKISLDKEMKDRSKMPQEPYTLYLHKEVIPLSKMKLLLQGFSHKNSLDGHISRGAAHIEVSIDGDLFDIYLALEIDDRKQKKHFDSLYSHGYEFHLQNFDYGKSIVLEVYKSEDERFRNLGTHTYFRKKD